MVKRKKECYACGADKEPERIKQPFCKGCHRKAMKDVRAGTINIRIDIASRIIALLPNTHEALYLSRIIERKENNLKRKIKKEQYD